MGDFAVGINIRVQSTPAPKAATTIRAAFEAAGLEARIIEVSDLRSGVVPHVYIGMEL